MFGKFNQPLPRFGEYFKLTNLDLGENFHLKRGSLSSQPASEIDSSLSASQPFSSLSYDTPKIKFHGPVTYITGNTLQIANLVNFEKLHLKVKKELRGFANTFFPYKIIWSQNDRGFVVGWGSAFYSNRFLFIFFTITKFKLYVCMYS